jgi:hypothetical protein
MKIYRHLGAPGVHRVEAILQDHMKNPDPASEQAMPGMRNLEPDTASSLDRRPPLEAAAGPRSSMGPQLVPGLGAYSGCCCHITRSNSLPSGSANVVCRTAYESPPKRTAGSLVSLSGLAPRPVSRPISSS